MMAAVAVPSSPTSAEPSWPPNTGKVRRARQAQARENMKGKLYAVYKRVADLEAQVAAHAAAAAQHGDPPALLGELTGRLALAAPVLRATLQHDAPARQLDRSRRNAAMHCFSRPASDIAGMGQQALNRLQRGAASTVGSTTCISHIEDEQAVHNHVPSTTPMAPMVSTTTTNPPTPDDQQQMIPTESMREETGMDLRCMAISEPFSAALAFIGTYRSLTASIPTEVAVPPHIVVQLDDPAADADAYADITLLSAMADHIDADLVALNAMVHTAEAGKSEIDTHAKHEHDHEAVFTASTASPAAAFWAWAAQTSEQRTQRLLDENGISSQPSAHHTGKGRATWPSVASLPALTPEMAERMAQNLQAGKRAARTLRQRLNRKRTAELEAELKETLEAIEFIQARLDYTAASRQQA